MRSFLILVSLIVALSLASAYTPEQQAVYDGLRLSYQIGEAHEKYVQTGDATSFNALVDQWNVWVRANFGEDPNLLMQKMTGPVDLQKPWIMANNTTQGGIVHAIDGSNKVGGAKYTTNDANLLPKGINAANGAEFNNTNTAWLGGV